MALRLFLHAFQTIFGNFPQALKASVVPFLFVAAIGLLTGSTMSVGVRPSGVSIILGIVWIIVTLFALGFIAASWHRYILLEEEPRLNGPSADRAFPYVGKSILLGLWLMLFIIPLMAVVIPLALPMMGSDGTIGSGALDYGLTDLAFELVVGTVIGALSLMYALVLPASALEQSMTFKESRLHTSRLGFELPVLAFLIVAFNVGTNYVLVQLVSGGAGIIASILSIGVQWLSMMISISILTTLYGHLAEGRDLPT